MSKKTSTPLVLGDRGSSPAFAGSFKKNLKDFFRLHGEKVSFAQMKHSWAHMVQVKYKAQDGSSTDLKLHFYTEIVRPDYNNIVCDECRIMDILGRSANMLIGSATGAWLLATSLSSKGWQHHAVGGKRVHVILPSEKTLGNPRTLMSLMEMRHRGWMHRARLDASKIQREKEEDYGDGTSEFVAAENMFYSKSHLLHGVFHMNGFGHLCRVNGREGGSSMYSGTELMRVWDELCCVLRTRMVSVEDVSNKLTMELRILLPLSYGNTWYGRWGYQFGRSPFNVQAEQWHQAVKSAASVRLADLIDACCQVTNGQMKPRRGWKAVLAVLQRYHNAPLLADKPSVAGADQSDAVGEDSCDQSHKIVTIGDLLRAMMDALRSPSKAWFTLLVAKGAAGQKPKEEQAPELKGAQIKESALMAAFHAQVAPPPIPPELLEDEDYYWPEPEVKPTKKRKAPAKNGTAATCAPAKADSKRAETKRAKVSGPTEAQGKRAKTVAASEAPPKRRGSSTSKTATPAEIPTKKESKKEPKEVAPAKKPPLLKIRKRPRSAIVQLADTAEPMAAGPLPAAPPVVQSQPLPPIATAAVEPAQVSAPTQPADSVQNLKCPVPADPVTDAAAIQEVGSADPIATAHDPKVDDYDSDDPGPAKKQARGAEDVTCTPPTVSLIATDAFAQPSSFDREPKEEYLIDEDATPPAELDFTADQAVRSRRSRQPSVRLARFDFDEKNEKPRRNGRQAHEDVAWKPAGPATNGVKEVQNGCDIPTIADRKPVRKRTPSAKAEGACLKSENVDVAMCTDDILGSSAKLPERTRSPAKGRVGRPSADQKASKLSVDSKVGKAATDAKGGKSAKGQAGKGGAKSMEKTPSAKSSIGKSAAGSPAGGSKASVGKAAAGTKPLAKSKGGKSSAAETQRADRQNLKSTSVLATVSAAVSSAIPPSSAENAPSEAMKLWCRNVDRLSPGGCIHESCATVNTLKNQIMSDLICLYFTLFRTDVSENLNIHYSLLPNITAWSGANLTKPPPPSNNAAVAQLRDALATLRYTKHFVKDYHGEVQAAGRPVKAVQPRTGKKKGAAAPAEARILVTVLMGFSFDRFGGPDAVEECPPEKPVNGTDAASEPVGEDKAVDKRIRPRSNRLRLATELGGVAAETASTQAADTDDAEVAYKTLRTSSPCCDGAEPSRAEPRAEASCHPPACNADQGVMNTDASAQQDPVAAAAKAIAAAACAAAVKADRCDAVASTEADASAMPEADGSAVPEPLPCDAVVSLVTGNASALQKFVEQATFSKPKSTNQEVSADEPGNASAAAEENPEMCAVGVTDRVTPATSSERTEAAGSAVMEEDCPSGALEEGCRTHGAAAAARNSTPGSCSAERHNSSHPPDAHQDTMARDRVSVEYRDDALGNTGDTGSKEQPCDTAGCDSARAATCDEKVQSVGDVPGSGQDVGEVPAPIYLTHAQELHDALHNPSALLPLLRPPPAELITCPMSITVGDLRRNIALSLKDTYEIFAKFRVDWLHWPQLHADSQHANEQRSEGPFWLGGVPDDKAKLDQFLPLSATEPVHIVVAGPGLDLHHSKMRHAGGEADWVVACHCGVTDDDGERMLCCDKCSRWVHSYCEGIADSQPDPTKFTCSQCSKPRGRA